MIKCKYWSGKDVESKVSSVYDEENRLVNMNDVEYDDEVPEDLDEIEELMVEALGLEDGPKLESEIDLMEWFAEMDEDDWSDLIEYTSDTDVDSSGCGSAGYDGSDGPRERGEEELMSPPPNIPNGGTGGSLISCPGGFYITYHDCIVDYTGKAGYNPEEECWEICFESDYTPFDYEELWSCMFPDRPGWDAVLKYGTYTTCVLSIFSLNVGWIAASCLLAYAQVQVCYNQADT